MLNIPAIHAAIDAFILTNPTESYQVHIQKDDRQRPYLGASWLGEECFKKVFLAWRHCFKPVFPPRIHRLFRDGDRAEYEFVWLLRGIGFTIYERDEDDKQFSVSDYDGHFRGNLDAVAEVPAEFWLEGYEPHPILLEFKTANDKKFNECRKQGLEKWHPKYFGQMQLYQGYMDLQGGLFCIKNKNDSDLFFENVSSQKRKFKRLVAKAGDTISATSPPDGISKNPSWYECKFCEGWGLCFDNKPSQKICRTCKFAEPAENKSWVCTRGNEYGTVCSHYKDIAKCS